MSSCNKIGFEAYMYLKQIQTTSNGTIGESSRNGLVLQLSAEGQLVFTADRSSDPRARVNLLSAFITTMKYLVILLLLSCQQRVEVSTPYGNYVLTPHDGEKTIYKPGDSVFLIQVDVHPPSLAPYHHKDTIYKTVLTGDTHIVDVFPGIVTSVSE